MSRPTLADVRATLRPPRVRMPRPRDVPYFDSYVLEVFLGLLSLGWGAWLLMPFDSFSSGFVVLAGIMPESVCGSIAFTIGAMRLRAAQRGEFVRATAWVGATFWAGVAAGLAGANPRSPGVYVYAFLCLANLAIIWRSAAALREQQESA